VAPAPFRNFFSLSLQVRARITQMAEGMETDVSRMLAIEHLRLLAAESMLRRQATASNKQAPEEELQRCKIEPRPSPPYEPGETLPEPSPAPPLPTPPSPAVYQPSATGPSKALQAKIPSVVPSSKET